MDIRHVTGGCPVTGAVPVDAAHRTKFIPPAISLVVGAVAAYGAPLIPPAIALVVGTVTAALVVVDVRSAEHHSVVRSDIVRYSISGVSAVPGHRQLVLADLITDGERRVFSPVPQTGSTLDLFTATRSINNCQFLVCA